MLSFHNPHPERHVDASETKLDNLPSAANPRSPRRSYNMHHSGRLTTRLNDCQSHRPRSIAMIRSPSSNLLRIVEVVRSHAAEASTGKIYGRKSAGETMMARRRVVVTGTTLFSSSAPHHSATQQWTRSFSPHRDETAWMTVICDDESRRGPSLQHVVNVRL